MIDARRFIDEFSGFFACGVPAHDEVTRYFNAKNFAEMFGQDASKLPDKLTWKQVRLIAHEMIDEYKSTEWHTFGPY